ncbi:hypothetical protein [Nocardioides sp. B-3]|uniref:hypothetical protein n=1 Tax=Nocardioides sp. B-3 TaxID=2895565 RepID=UPI00215290A4|nr:hypothetical protein [Nocardioides sp. B-3]UUZ59335.1 hypothetical protein LP418_26370 [Nocardioides sp. B-3]
MNARNAGTVSAGIKLGIFTVVSIVFTTTLAVIMGGIGLGRAHGVQGHLLECQ